MLPARLNPGDTIGIVAPSTPVTQELEAQFAAGIAFLETLGFQVVTGRHIYSTSWEYTAAPQEKATDINRMFADPVIHAIVCAQGGSTANACLPYLDWNMIRANPKIVLGISDITVLLNAITHYTGLITFHGNDVMWGFGRHPTPYDVDEFKRCLMMGRSGLIPPNGPRKTVRSGAAEGTLWGGNLHCLQKLIGTPYCPHFTDAILFIEALDIKPEVCDHLFHQLQQAGVFDRVRGVIVGYIDGLQNDPEAAHQMEDILVRITAEYTFPVLKMDDFGHNCPNTVLPVGGRARLDADAHTLEIIEPVVRPE
ncbi:MAG: LD-carboxypeptidase [Anaerolineae bacterium]|nr:LD-carboxypeptidase [Anaerolineae bacterium]